MVFDYVSFAINYPKISIVVVAGIISLFISLVNYFVLDKDRVRELRDKQKHLNEQMKVHKENPQKLKEIQSEMMSHMGESMKHSFKPMIITTIPLLVVLPFIRHLFAETTIAYSWFWWYFVSAIVFSMIFRKLFKLP